MKIAPLFAISFFAASANSAVILDDFDTGNITVVDTVLDGIAVDGFASGLGVLGGERDVSVNLMTNPFGTTGASANVANGFYSANVPSGSMSEYIIQWDGIDGSMDFDTDGLGSVDFLTGTTALAITLAFSDTTSSFTLDICDTGGINCNDATFPFLGFPDGGTRIIPWDDPEFAGIDFTTVSGVQATITGGRAFDLTIDNVASNEVPAPGSAYLLGMGLGLLGLAGAARKAKR